MNKSYSTTYKGREFRTNVNGEGLWIDGKQDIGTCQFRANSQSFFRRQIVKMFSEDCSRER